MASIDFPVIAINWENIKLNVEREPTLEVKIKKVVFLLQVTMSARTLTKFQLLEVQRHGSLFNYR